MFFRELGQALCFRYLFETNTSDKPSTIHDFLDLFFRYTKNKQGIS